jgi:hypothetical protein
VRSPGQAVGSWVTATGRRRVTATAGETYYVAKGGSDSTGEGTQARPWRTIQFAVDLITETIDANGHTVTIQVGPSNVPGISTAPWEGFEVRQPLQGAGRTGFRISGQLNNPDTCLIGGSLSAPGYCIYVHGGRIAIGGFSFADCGANGVSMCCDGRAAQIVLDGYCFFDTSNLNTAHIQAMAGGIIYIETSYQIVGGPSGLCHFKVTTLGVIMISVPNLQISREGILTLAYFVVCESGGICQLGDTLSMPGPRMTTTKKWRISGMGVLFCRPASAWDIVPGEWPEAQGPAFNYFIFQGGQYVIRGGGLGEP